MLPSFLSLEGGVAGAPVEVPPPPGFRKIEGEIDWVILGSTGSRSPGGRSASQRAGARYEEKVQEVLVERFKDLFFPQQEIIWRDERGEARCYLDGLLMTGKSVIAIEIKSQHMPESWWQLYKYERLLKTWGGLYDRHVLRLEICKSLDAAMPYPEKYRVAESIDDFIIHSSECSLGVLQWKL